MHPTLKKKKKNKKEQVTVSKTMVDKENIRKPDGANTQNMTLLRSNTLSLPLLTIVNKNTFCYYCNT